MIKKKPRHARVLGYGVAGLLVAATSGIAHATDPASMTEGVDDLKQRVDEQRQQIELLREALQRQDMQLLELKRVVETPRLQIRGGASSATSAGASAGASRPNAPARPPEPQQIAQAQQPVGQAPE